MLTRAILAFFFRAAVSLIWQSAVQFEKNSQVLFSMFSDRKQSNVCFRIDTPGCLLIPQYAAWITVVFQCNDISYMPGELTREIEACFICFGS
jgi:hypothetical protein